MTSVRQERAWSQAVKLTRKRKQKNSRTNKFDVGYITFFVSMQEVDRLSVKD